MKNIRIHPATIFVLFLLIVTGFGTVIIPYFVAVILHELGHAFVAKKLGYSLNKIWILPYGACLSFEEFSFSPNDEIKIALAGPLTNIALVFMTFSSWWIFPETYTYTYFFAIANFSIALFNLLPAFPLDGGRVLTSILSLKFKRKAVFKTACILNMIFSFAFMILFFISCFFTINFSLGLIGIFLFIGIIDSRFQGKYSPLLFEFNEKQKRQILPVKNFCVSSKTPFFKILPELNRHKYNVIYVQFSNGNLKMVTEYQFKKILESKSLNSCFDEI